MHEAITAKNITKIKSPFFRENAQLYIDIEAEYRTRMASFGLDYSHESYLTPYDPWVEGLTERGLSIANDHRSLHIGWISPSCLSCRKGVGAATFQFSNQCPRNCFFCFNRNQKDYERLLVEMDDPIAKIEAYHADGVVFHDLALSGGEPLLHTPKVIEYFATIRRFYPDAYTRLYTSGAFFDVETAEALANAGLDEIRFSIKTDDSEIEREKLFSLMSIAKAALPAVMVEMPAMPDEFELMKDLLVRLDRLGINGINLLELGFPFNNAEEYARRGYKLKPQLFRTLYDYTYAAGLPVAGSEDVCLRLLGFALDQRLRLGVHYCSLENKHSAQIYLQNIGYKDAFDFCEFSERDYFLKSVKAFGKDADLIERFLVEKGLENYRKDSEDRLIEFPPSYVSRLRRSFPKLQLGLSYHVITGEGDAVALRELRLDLITPKTFNLGKDV